MDTPSIFLFNSVSVVMTILSFFLGVAHLSFGGHSLAHGHGHFNVPHAHGLDLGHGHAGIPHLAHDTGAAHAIHPVHPPHGAVGHAVDVEGISPFNMATALAFFTWFGGAGYLLTATCTCSRYLPSSSPPWWD